MKVLTVMVRLVRRRLIAVGTIGKLLGGCTWEGTENQRRLKPFLNFMEQSLLIKSHALPQGIWVWIETSLGEFKGCVRGLALISSSQGILQARILEWIAISFSRGSSRPRD